MIKKIKIDPPITVSKKVDSVNVLRWIDDPNKKIVAAGTGENDFGLVILWEGDAYDAIGNWTEEQAEARLVEILQTKY